MKKLILLGFVIVLFTACENKEKRYTQQSPEIETFKEVIKAYQARDWETMRKHYADTTKIMNNTTKENAQTIDQELATNKEDASLFSSWKYDPESVEYEMVINDDGETWVNFWGDWEGVLAANSKVYVIPVHITTRFVGGKIVREHGYWDISKLMLDIQAIETEQNMPVDETK